MKRLIFVGSLFTAMLLFAPQNYAAETTAADNEIRQAAREFCDAFDHGNAEAIASHWTADCEYTVGQEHVKGREAVGRLYAEFLKAHPGAEMTVAIDSIREIAPMVAIEQGTASVKGGADGRATSSTYTAVHVKQGDRWLMANVRESELPSSGSEDSGDLSWLVGEWASDGDASKVTMNYQWMANKHFLRGEINVSAGQNGGSAAGGTQIIGKDPQSGRIVSWFFNADGGHGYGEWARAGNRWMINTIGMSADGAPTSATNILYQASGTVVSWQSVNRAIGEMRLPDAKEVVIERVSTGN